MAHIEPILPTNTHQGVSPEQHSLAYLRCIHSIASLAHKTSPHLAAKAIRLVSYCLIQSVGAHLFAPNAAVAQPSVVHGGYRGVHKSFHRELVVELFNFFQQLGDGAEAAIHFSPLFASYFRQVVCSCSGFEPCDTLLADSDSPVIPLCLALAPHALSVPERSALCRKNVEIATQLIQQIRSLQNASSSNSALELTDHLTHLLHVMWQVQSCGGILRGNTEVNKEVRGAAVDVLRAVQQMAVWAEPYARDVYAKLTQACAFVEAAL
eukprot:c19023_g2_i1.p1 GENE.c19023_g2_i1~~c19023_g2_i1.p1  ORF type:complete len:266 (+),score=51.79 c19023_g2_i1:3-800(+)